jgi:hypothetical protein
MIMYGLAPVCCYIVSGPNADPAVDGAFWALYLASQNSDVGTSGSRAYMPERSAGEGNSVDGVTRIGPTATRYDPELAMFFGLEF